MGGARMIVGVLVELSNQNIDRVFDYHVPDELASQIKIGIRVLVPFGRMELEGFVLEIKDKTDSDYELKDINDDKNRQLLQLLHLIY